MTSDKKIRLEDALRELEQTREKIERDLRIGHDIFAEIQREIKNHANGIRLVAVAALFTIALWVFAPSLMKVDSQALFTKNYTKLTQPLEARSGQGDAIKDAIHAYQEGRINAALDMFTNERIRDKSPDVANFYEALCLLEKKEIEQAGQLLNKLANQGEIIQPELHWYMALVWLHQENYNQARTSLKAMKGIDQKYKKKERKSLLRKIRFR